VGILVRSSVNPFGGQKKLVAVEQQANKRPPHGVVVINRETANGSFSKRGTG
jgi:hypothetical protein